MIKNDNENLSQNQLDIATIPEKDKFNEETFDNYIPINGIKKPKIEDLNKFDLTKDKIY